MKTTTIYWVTLDPGLGPNDIDRRFRALVMATEPYKAALMAVRRLRSKSLKGNADLWCTREVGPAWLGAQVPLGRQRATSSLATASLPGRRANEPQFLQTRETPPSAISSSN